MKHTLVILGLTLAGILSASAEEAKLSQEAQEFFENKVRPVLSENCFKCHSTQHNKSKAGLTLDTRTGLLKGSVDGPVVVPGDPESSKLVKAIRYTDPDGGMPPDGKKMPDAQIATLVEWVKMGAPFPDTPAAAKLTGLTNKARSHWAYQPVKRQEPPAVSQTNRVATPVDAFILAKLEANGMKPSPPATREALIRRATYDLTGLPPSPAEVRAFLADNSPDAFAHVVDRLLASPHYGERWGRYWLDTARYSDTTGLEGQDRAADYRYAYAWAYRDYVIDAFNRDKPYDQFIMEQLAADRLPLGQDKSTLAALGFLTVGQRFRMPQDTINDRIDVVSKGFLGMTVSCARCHDHKFDPVSQKDYYSLYGVFLSSYEPAEKPLLKPVVNTPEYQDYRKVLAELEQKNRDAYYNQLRKMLGEFRRKAGAYLLTAHISDRRGSAEQIELRSQLMRKHQLDDEILREVQRQTRRREDNIVAPLRMFAALSDGEFATKATEVITKIAGSRHINPMVAAAFKSAKIASMDDVAGVYTRLFASIEESAQKLLEARSKAAGPQPAAGMDPALVELIELPWSIQPAGTLTTAALRRAVESWPNRKLQDAGFFFAHINELELTHPAAPARAMVLLDSDKPRDSHIFLRGEANNRGPIAPRQFLEVLSPPKAKPFADGSGRLEMAKLIASRDNPLTARVAVNRVWMHHFGEGFVPTPDDLGTQSEPPSHPELLDFLATEFMDNGWSLKKLHRLIMLSNVYQQSSETNPVFQQKDPRNRLLWRANIRRLDFEAQRDSLLVFGGVLDRTIGGKPINLTDEPYSYRRSIYGYVDRGRLPELMSNFDFSDPHMPNSKRNTTVVPQQALFFMNSKMVVDIVRRLMARTEVTSAMSDYDRIAALYRIVYQRPPRQDEIKLAMDFMAGERRDDVIATATLGRPNRPGTAAVANPPARPAPPPRRVTGRATIQNTDGEYVEQRQQTIWEIYAQALLMANEAAYIY